MSDDLPDPVAYAQSRTNEELLGYRGIFGEDSREWVIAQRELARRELAMRPPTRWQRLRPWVFQALWVGIVVYVYFRWR
jgi:hypothetical protein